MIFLMYALTWSSDVTSGKSETGLLVVMFLRLTKHIEAIFLDAFIRSARLFARAKQGV